MAVLQMTWQPSSLNQKRKSGPPLGLKNLGNTCYLNSVLQCLTYTPPLANFCLKSQHSSSCDSAGAASEKKKECPFCILEKRIVRSLSIDSALDTPVKINSCLKIFAQHFRHGRQEDAHEFLRYVIDACHNTCLRLKKLQLQRRKGGNGGESGNGNTIVKEIFGGALQSQVKCLSCGAESNKVDDIMDISLDILQCGSLKDALQRFFQPEILDGNNKYKCDNCKKLVAARKQMSILQAPNVLVIQLKRFEGIFGGKIDKAIAFEEVLVLSSYMYKGSQDLHPEYTLCGTIVHSGFSPDSGHYYAYIKDAMCRWYCCNDSYVTLSSLKEVLSEKVYILFFTRSKQRLPLVKTGLLANGSKCHRTNVANGSKCHQSNGRDANGTKCHQSNGSDANGTKCHQSNGSDANGSKCHQSNGSDANGSKCHQSNGSDANGLKCNQSNGSDASRILKSGHLEKVVDTKHVSDQHSQTNNLITSKVDKVPSSLPRKLSVSENSDTRKYPANGGIKIIVHKKELDQKTGNPAALNDTESNQNNVQTLADGNGVSKVRPDDAFDAVNSRSPSTISNGNCKIQNDDGDTLEGDHHEDCDLRDNMAIGRTPNHKELSNGDVKPRHDCSGLKRKSQDKDSCVLLAKDAQSRAKVEEFKKVIEKEASLVLASCGWSEEVYNFMRSRKKLCMGGSEYDASNINQVKRLLIKDAKSTFISKIPESLKGRLIENLVLFSKEKQPSGTSAI